MKSFKVWYRQGHFVSSICVGLPDLEGITEDHIIKVAKVNLKKLWGKNRTKELQIMKIEEV